jgi:protein-disulfide isomerase
MTKRKQIVEGLATATLVICALLMTTIVVRREFFAPEPPGVEPTRFAEWREFTTPEFRVGAPNPRVTLVVFSDFECPFCSRLAAFVDTMLTRYPSDVAMDFRHYPIPALHRNAVAAAVASECARSQGRFKEFHDLMFQRQKEIGVDPWPVSAARAGIADTAAFSRCLGDAAPVAKLAADSVAAARLEVSGTPTLLVNQWRVAGAPTLQALDSLIRGEIDAAKRQRR